MAGKTKTREKGEAGSQGQPPRITAKQRAKAQREVAQRLCAWRKELGLSQAAVAKAVRLSPALVSRIERGERSLDPLELARFARLYGKSIVDFFSH